MNPEIDEYGNKFWRNEEGQLHREDGPAVERANGTKEWFKNGKLHREDGPAIEWDDGTKEWYKNGQLHRDDGPAVERANGTKEWWVNGLPKEKREKKGNKLASLIQEAMKAAVDQGNTKVLKNLTEAYENL